MPEINIRPCPFCGEEAKTNVSAGIPEENLPFGWGWVGCQKCRCFISYNHGERGLKEAVAVWNRRVDNAKD